MSTPPSASPPDPLVGQVVADRYRVERLIARGGMGSIYLAEQLPLGRWIALKVLVPASLQQEQGPELRARFLLEAGTCARLRHPNTVTVYDYGSVPAGTGGLVDGALFIAMEYVNGRTLARAIKSDGPFAPARAARIARRIAQSLREAHTMGFVHRDLKPGNIMLLDGERPDQVKVLDFGVAKVLDDAQSASLTAAGNFVGSPRYAAPEQIREDAVDGRADLYSLGIVLYEMLTGGSPYKANDTMRMLLAHVQDAPEPVQARAPGTPQGLAEVVHRLLAKSPSDRYADASALIEALRPYEDDGSEPALVGAASSTSRVSTLQNRTLVQGAGIAAVGAVGLGVLLMGAAGLAWWFTRPAPPEVVAPAPITVALRSVPPADVYEGATRLGTTPLVLEAPAPRDLLLRAAGFQDARVQLGPAQAEGGVDVTLRAVAPAAPAAPAPPKPAPRPRAPRNDDIRTER